MREGGGGRGEGGEVGHASNFLQGAAFESLHYSQMTVQSKAKAEGPDACSHGSPLG